MLDSIYDLCRLEEQVAHHHVPYLSQHHLDKGSQPLAIILLDSR